MTNKFAVNPNTTESEVAPTQVSEEHIEIDTGAPGNTGVVLTPERVGAIKFFAHSDCLVQCNCQSVDALCASHETLRAEVERLKADAEIARLAREYVAAFKAWRDNDQDTKERRCFGDQITTHRALIAAVEREQPK